MPLPPSRFNMPNAPGAPIAPKGSVVCWPKQGQPVPARSGCLSLTTIGHVLRLAGRRGSCCRGRTDVDRVDPEDLAEDARRRRLCLHVIVSFAPNPLEIVMPPGARPPPFSSPYCCASDMASFGFVGSACAPASAAASAVACNARFFWYQDPTSTAIAVIPSSLARTTANRGRTCPRSTRTRKRWNGAAGNRRRLSGRRTDMNELPPRSDRDNCGAHQTRNGNPTCALLERNTRTRDTRSRAQENRSSLRVVGFE